MHFESPWFFLVLGILPLLFYRGLRRRQAGVLFSSVQPLREGGYSWRQRFLWVPVFLRFFALVALVIALARPQQGMERVRDASQGIAIEMVVDRSGSMGAEMSFNGKDMTRLDVVKQVFSWFVQGNKQKGLKGRPNDLVGMVAFARYADTVCPLTLAHGALEKFLDTVHLAQRREEDGTAIGDAVALAAARLKNAGETYAHQRELHGNNAYTIKSKVIILLTDGQANCGKRSPLEAAKLAAQWGVKIYAIGVGGGQSFTTVRTPFGDYKMPVNADLDESTLKAMAKESGGIYRRADDADSLLAIYKEIDSLEKTDLQSIRYLDYREWFTPFALAAAGALLLEILLRTTLFRRVP